MTLGRALLTAADVKAALVLRREWPGDVFSDHMASARLLMSPAKVRALMLRLILAREAIGSVTIDGAGWARHTYRMGVDPATPHERVTEVDQEARDAAIWQRLIATRADILGLKDGRRRA